MKKQVPNTKQSENLWHLPCSPPITPPVTMALYKAQPHLRDDGVAFELQALQGQEFIEVVRQTLDPRGITTPAGLPL